MKVEVGILLVLLMVGCSGGGGDGSKAKPDLNAAASDKGGGGSGGDAELVAPMVASALGLTADDEYLYVLEGAVDSGTLGGIVKVNKATGDTEVLQADVVAFRITSDADHLYYRGLNEINKVSKNGGPPEILVSGIEMDMTDFFTFDLTADETSVFYVGTDNVWSVPVEGGAPQELVSDIDDIGFIAVEDSMLYIAAGITPTRIYSVAKGGGSPTELASDADHHLSQSPGAFGQLSIGASELYFTVEYHNSFGNGSISRIPKSGGVIEDIATGMENPSSVVEFDGEVFWATVGGVLGGDGKVYRGGTELISDGYNYIFCMHVDNDYIWFTAEDDDDAGGLYRVPR